MKCPIDGTPLVMADRAGVEIDYCPQCRGVWLDRGELDKIIERSAPQTAHHPAEQQRSPGYAMPGYDRKSHKNSYKQKKKKSFLDDIFDF